MPTPELRGEPHAPPIIWIVSHNAERLQRWTRVVSTVGLCCQPLEAHASDLPLPDVIVSDLPLEALSGIARFRDAHGDFASLLIGTTGEADVEFSEEPADGELSRACRLLAEIVTLRRSLVAMERRSEELRQFANLDPLTNLPNRRAWDENLSSQWQRAMAEDGTLVLVIIDLNDFKRINEQCGLARGDELLVEVARCLARWTNNKGLLARYGGDEFAWLIPVPEFRADEVVARRATDGPDDDWEPRIAGLADGLCLSLVLVEHGLPSRDPGSTSAPGRSSESEESPSITATAGWAWACPRVSGTPAELFAAADARLRDAKAKRV